MSLHNLFDGSSAQDLTAEDRFRAAWSAKTAKQVERELASMHRYVQRNSSSYAWHGANAAPGSMTDGDKIIVLREILVAKGGGA
jgi:hypothetical protein